MPAPREMFTAPGLGVSKSRFLLIVTFVRITGPRFPALPVRAKRPPPWAMRRSAVASWTTTSLPLIVVPVTVSAAREKMPPPLPITSVLLGVSRAATSVLPLMALLMTVRLRPALTMAPPPFPTGRKLRSVTPEMVATVPLSMNSSWSP